MQLSPPKNRDGSWPFGEVSTSINDGLECQGISKLRRQMDRTQQLLGSKRPAAHWQARLVDIFELVLLKEVLPRGTRIFFGTPWMIVCYNIIYINCKL